MQFRGEFECVLGEMTDLNQNQLGSSLSVIITNTIKKFQSLAHKILLLILPRFSGKLSLFAVKFGNAPPNLKGLFKIIKFLLKTKSANFNIIEDYIGFSVKPT